jgi:hypothetical protein
MALLSAQETDLAARVETGEAGSLWRSAQRAIADFCLAQRALDEVRRIRAGDSRANEDKAKALAAAAATLSGLMPMRVGGEGRGRRDWGGLGLSIPRGQAYADPPPASSACPQRRRLRRTTWAPAMTAPPASAPVSQFRGFSAAGCL